MAYIRDIVINLRHDPAFVAVALPPTVISTIERVLLATCSSWSVNIIREYVPEILRHRLVPAPHLKAVGARKIALILASISQVAIPP